MSLRKLINFVGDSVIKISCGNQLISLGTQLSNFVGESTNFLFTPSFGFGVYNDGDGKKLGNNIQFRTTLEVSYQFSDKKRIGLSFGHISNANLGGINPGVEIISLSYQIPY